MKKQEGQVELKLLTGAFYVNENWLTQESNLKDLTRTIFIVNQIKLFENAMVLKTEEEFEEWCQKDMKGLIDMENVTFKRNLSSEKIEKLKINGYSSQHLSYEEANLSGNRVQRDIYWIYTGVNVIYAEWQQLPENNDQDIEITKEEWQALISTLHLCETKD